MYEDAQEIFDYLPIRRDTLENDYINHLWQAFSTLEGGEAVAHPFAVMPFHLLFMLAITLAPKLCLGAQRNEALLPCSGIEAQIGNEEEKKILKGDDVMANGGVSAKGIVKDDTAKSDRIRSCIHTIRDFQVMLDLADLYKIEVKALNQAVRRNAERFPAAYMFQLTANEHTSLRSQIVTLKKRGRHSKDLQGKVK